MAGELSGILEHVERIAELDLDGVEPTSHVIALENVLRPDEPRPSWPREAMLERAPDPAERRLPRPLAAGVSGSLMPVELLELTVAQAAERIRSGELAADEYFDAYREAAAGDALNAFLWRERRGPRR